MTSNWEMVRLGDIAETLLGKTLPRGAGQTVGGAPYLRNVNVQWGRVDTIQLNSMPFDESERTKYELRRGDLLVCEGGEIGRLAIIDKDMPGVYFQNAIHRVRANTKVNPWYLALSLEHLVKSGGLEGISTRVTIAHLNQAKLRELPVALPPLVEQRRIVDLIGALDDAIEAADVVPSIIQGAKAAIVGHHLIAEHATYIDSIAEVSQGRALPKDVQGLRTGEISWFKISDMTREPNLFGYSEANTRMTMTELAAIGGRLVPVGAVVFPRVGAAVLTEKKRIMDTSGALDENHLILTPKSEGTSEVLLAAVERLELSSLVQAGAVPSLNIKLIRATKLPWAKAADLPVLNQLCAAARQAIDSASARAESLRTLRAELLTSLLSGAHTIPESYDELLEAVDA